jgi:hypothetical protein
MVLDRTDNRASNPTPSRITIAGAAAGHQPQHHLESQLQEQLIMKDSVAENWAGVRNLSVLLFIVHLDRPPRFSLQHLDTASA